MLRIGLIGESPNDTNAFRNLFSRQYAGKFDFINLVENKLGGNLDQISDPSPMMNQLRLEYRLEKPDFVILIRDLDALETDLDKMNERLTRMYALGRAVTQNAIYLLCIWEMETLLLADLNPVNDKYNTNLVYPASPSDPSDPMLKKDPKGFLKSNSGYHPNDCPELFKTIDFNKLLSVRFFKEFVPKFEARIK